MKSRFNIRLVASPSKLSKQAAAHLYSLDRSIFSRDAPPIELQHTYWWLVFDGHVPIAFAGLCTNGNTGFVVRVGVLPLIRGAGIQRRLIRVMDKLARGLGLAENITYTDSIGVDGIVSSNNFIRCGYRLFKPETNEDPGWLWWKKDLRKGKND